MMLFIIGYNSLKQISRFLTERLFVETLLSAIIMVLFDIICWLVDGESNFIARAVNTVSSGCYLYLTAFSGCMWLCYVDLKFNDDRSRGMRKRIKLYSIPADILFVFTVLSPFTDWVFYIDENNCYQRGPLHFVQVLAGSFYLIYSAAYAIYKARREITVKKKKEYFSFVMFSMLPLLGGLLQIILPNLPLTIVGFSLAIMMVYINFQNKRVSQDSLTGINNRHSLNLYIDQVLNEGEKHGKLTFFLLMDIDRFKKINDTYGHVEGDRAITAVADLLSNVSERNQDFVARYGGDEFAIVCERGSTEEVEQLKSNIELALKKENEEKKFPYTLALSIGYSQFFVDGNEQDEIISAADRYLYKSKSIKKQNAQ